MIPRIVTKKMKQSAFLLILEMNIYFKHRTTNAIIFNAVATVFSDKFIWLNLIASEKFKQKKKISSNKFVNENFVFIISYFYLLYFLCEVFAKQYFIILCITPDIPSF